MNTEGSAGLRFAGYASVFDHPDRGGDIVLKGAFARAVKTGAAGFPLLWQHDPSNPIGRLERLEEDARGLRVIARLSQHTQSAREAAALLSEGAIWGLSFGYRARGARPRMQGRGRILEDLDLIEISLVTFPMHPLAKVHALQSVE